MERKLKWFPSSAILAPVLAAAVMGPPMQRAAAQAPPAAKTFDTMEYRIRVVPVAEVRNPYGMAFLPGGDMLVTQMNGDIRMIRGGKMLPQPVGQVPGVHVAEAGPIFIASGLMDIALHPRFAQNRWVYYTYIKPGSGGTMTVGRATFDGSQLRDYTEIFAANAAGPEGGNTSPGSRSRRTGRCILPCPITTTTSCRRT